MHVAKVYIGQGVVDQPFAPLGCRAIAPFTRGNQMIGIKRFQIGAHLRHPGAALGPAPGHTLCFIHQLVTKDCRIVAVHDAADAIAPGSNFLEMLAIKAARGLVRIKLHRLFIVDAERIFVVVGPGNSGPSQVLRDAAGVPPPVRQAQLHPQAIARSFDQHAIEKDELLFVPLVGFRSK